MIESGLEVVSADSPGDESPLLGPDETKGHCICLDDEEEPSYVVCLCTPFETYADCPCQTDPDF